MGAAMPPCDASDRRRQAGTGGAQARAEAKALSALDWCLYFRSPFFPTKMGSGPYTIRTGASGNPYLAIGDMMDARNLVKLRANNIGAVLNLSDMDHSHVPYGAAGITYHKIDCMDLPNFPIIADTFPKAKSFLDDQAGLRQQILVHCTMGVNRSSAVCCAYLIQRERIPLAEAGRYVVSARKHPILTNPGFRQQLAYSPWSSVWADTHIEKGFKRRSFGNLKQWCWRMYT